MAIFKLTRWPSILLFALAGVVTVIFAFSTANLFSHAMANVEFIREFGWVAIENGALVQVFELLFFGALSLSCWLIFKICEALLSERYRAWSKKD